MLALVLHSGEASGAELITFEEFTPPPNPLLSQYCLDAATNLGVEFLEQVQVLPAPVATSTPSHAVTTLSSQEFDELRKIQIRFTAKQSQAGVRVGLDRAYTFPVTARMRAYSSLVPDPLFLLDESSVLLGSGPRAITQPIAVQDPSTRITTVVIEFVGPTLGQAAFEWVDDLTFSQAGPTCGTDLQPPVVEITIPATDLQRFHVPQIRLAFTARDTQSGVASVEVELGRAGGLLTVRFFACGGPKSLACPLPGDVVSFDFLTNFPTEFRNQIGLIRVTATDFAGRTGRAEKTLLFQPPHSTMNVWALGMEITQAVQPWIARASATRSVEIPEIRSRSGVRLVAGKRTVVRVYSGVENSGTNPITGLTARLVCSTATFGPCPGPAFVNPAFGVRIDPGDNNALDLLQRESTKSFSFQLPLEWLDLINFRLTVTIRTPPGIPECAGCDDGANSLQVSGISFFQQDRLEITPIFVCVRRDPRFSRTVCDHVPLGTERSIFQLLGSIFVQTYPIAESDIDLVMRPKSFLLVDGDFSRGGALTQDRYYSAQNDVCDLRDSDDPPSHVVYIGLIPTPAEVGGLGRVNEKCATATINTTLLNSSTATVAQEVGHSVGLDYHTSCDHGEDVLLADGSRARCLEFPDEFPCEHGGICAHGFDTANLEPVIKDLPGAPNAHIHDFMSYGSSNIGGFRNDWVSPFVFEEIFDRLRVIGPSAAAPLSASVGGLGGLPLWLRGAVVFDHDGITADLSPAYVVTPGDAVSNPGAGPFTLELLDSAGTVREARSFEFGPLLAHDCCGGDAGPVPMSFFEILPQPPGVARVALKHGATLLAERARSPHAPGIRLDAPVGGEFWEADEEHEILWTAGDGDGDPLAYLVQYSADAGSTWETLAFDWPEASFLVEAGELAGSDAAVVRVFASDGLNTSVAVSGPFTVEAKAPEVWITSPDPSSLASFDADARVLLQGGGTDMEEGPLVDSQLAWRSGLDGPLGTGRRLDVTSLSPGLHTVELEGRGLDGATSTATALIEIVPPPNTQPIADAGPDQMVSLGRGVSLDGLGSFDPDGDPLSYDWEAIARPAGSSAPLSNPAVAQPILFPDRLGEYELELVVHDNQVGSVGDTTIVTVVDNQAPVAICRDVTVAAGAGVCTAKAVIDDGSFDPDGDSLTLSQTPAGPYDLGTTRVVLTVTDDRGASDSCEGTVTVRDTIPPVILSLLASPDELWPVNHKLVPIEISHLAADICDPAPVLTLLSITMDEEDGPIPGVGDGHTADDIQVDESRQILLRAERGGTGNGRVYTLTFEARDESGNASTAATTVSVPHDR
jgi:hypothetical protein